jgi:queuine tRNA-ribosyltransferase
VSAFRFELLAQRGKLRRGRFHTPHGTFETPCFAPVGTYATLKGLTPEQVQATGTELILANSYHLHVRPGAERIERLGGLHRFMGWNGPILTDSGGYQVFSLGGKVKVDDDAVTFQSVIDGSTHRCTPESVLAFQRQLGPDIAMVLDHCPPGDGDASTQREAHERTLRWARRARDLHETWGGSARGQAVFGICQGGTDPELRAQGAQAMAAMDFDGYAIGGLSVGEPNEVMYGVVASTTPLLPADRPRYLMGVGTPIDIVEAVARGVDMFDCVLPTRNARNGQLFTSEGVINIKNAAYAEDDRPMDPACRCYSCKHFSRAYLRHLFMAGEMTSGTLNTVHNLTYYLDTMQRIRQAIAFGTFAEFRQDIHRTFTRRALIS